MKFNKKRKVAITLCALILVIIIFRSGKNEEIFITIGHPSRGKITEYATGNGKLLPSKEVCLTSEIPGEILNIYAQEGDIVKKGELIVKLKEEDYLSEVEKAKTSHKIAQEQYLEYESRYSLQKRIYTRDSMLMLVNAISSEEFEKSQTEYRISLHQLNSARYNIESAKTAITEAEKALAKTSIFSPIEGTILEINANIGEKVVGTSQMAGTQIMRIADMESLEVVAQINEHDILNVSVADSVCVRIDALSTKRIAGRVRKIAQNSNNRHNGLQVGEYTVKIKLDSLPRDLKSGMGASIEIHTISKNNILTLPIEAIIAKECDFGEETQIKEYVFIYLPESSTVEMKEIVTGIQDFRRIEVVSGAIDESTIIVTGPYNTLNKELKEGIKVRYE